MYVAHDAFNRDLERLIGASEAGRRALPGRDRHLAIVQQAAPHPPQRRGRGAVAPPVRGGHRRGRDPDPHRHGGRARLARPPARADRRRDQGARRDRARRRAQGPGPGPVRAHDPRGAGRPSAARAPYGHRQAGTPSPRRSATQQGGLKGAAEYLPWVLDGATDETKTQVLRLLPPPARLLYRRVWEKKYRSSGRLA